MSSWPSRDPDGRQKDWYTLTAKTGGGGRAERSRRAHRCLVEHDHVDSSALFSHVVLQHLHTNALYSTFRRGRPRWDTCSRVGPEQQNSPWCCRLPRRPWSGWSTPRCPGPSARELVSGGCPRLEWTLLEGEHKTEVHLVPLDAIRRPRRRFETRKTLKILINSQNDGEEVEDTKMDKRWRRIDGR